MLHKAVIFGVLLSSLPVWVGSENSSASFHVGAMSCTSCEKAIRSNLAKFKPVEVVLADAGKKRVELKFAPDKVSLQQILKVIAGKDGHYEARLALQYVDDKLSAAQAEKTRAALTKVPGVRAASMPDKDRIILLTFRDQPPAYLPAILKAAEESGGTLRDPESATAN
ncbi:MAG: heavy-metal-associated domain-containing protein [Armatimonadetes bacterium]|nr:heavy-metal-associated domain-containing protein [Armatimonadota bacterium]